MQKPQWTQARRIFSAAFVAGSASWAAEKFGLHVRYRLSLHPAGVQHVHGIEAVLDPRRQFGERTLRRLKHGDALSGRFRRDEERGVAAVRLHGGANDGGAGVRSGLLGVEAQPDEAAAPIEQRLRRWETRPDFVDDGGREVRRRAQAPDDAPVRRQKAMNLADLLPEPSRGGVVQPRAMTEEALDRIRTIGDRRARDLRDVSR